jgi:NAD(P)-dependent dehydrogenase (short-subunit alcohol dehydrogenase family)
MPRHRSTTNETSEETPMSFATYPSLQNRTVFVSGGGSGIGAAIVRAFCGTGARVGFVDIAEAPSRALVDELTKAGGTVRYENADVTDTAALTAAIGRIRDALGPITVLVNNAAHDQRHDFFAVTPAYFDERIAVNLKHAFFAAQAIVPDMQAAGGGAIVNIGSASYLMGSDDLTVYGAAKSAAIGLTRMLARQFGKDGIRVNCIVPGWIMTQRQLDLWVTPDGERQIAERQCLKRKLVPDDIARPVLFLASDEAGGMTNQSIIVDGGWV